MDDRDGFFCVNGEQPYKVLVLLAVACPLTPWDISHLFFFFFLSGDTGTSLASNTLRVINRPIKLVRARHETCLGRSGQ